MTRRSFRTKFAALAATGVMALGTGVLAASPAQADSSFGCPSGAVCIYLGTDWYQAVPTYQMFWTAKVHKIYGQEGQHIVYNNQTHGWTVRLCYDGAGTNCGPKMQPGDGWPVNLSPINSIKIERP